MATPLFCCRSAKNSRGATKFDPELAQLDWEKHQRRLAEQEAEQAESAEDELLGRGQRCIQIAVVAYPVLGALCTCLLVWTSIHYPLVLFWSHDAEWGQRWLVAAVVDYYTCALCLVGVILASEDWFWGFIWTASVLTMGAPFACAYLVSQLCTHSTLALCSARHPLPPSAPEGGGAAGYTLGLYVVSGFLFMLRLSWTFWRYPLFPVQEDPEWLREWLFTTIGDYSLAALCLCGIIFATESQGPNVIWGAAVLVLSGPGACAYMTYRSVCCFSLALSSGHIDMGGEPQAMQKVSSTLRKSNLASLPR